MYILKKIFSTIIVYNILFSDKINVYYIGNSDNVRVGFAVNLTIQLRLTYYNNHITVTLYQNTHIIMTHVTDQQFYIMHDILLTIIIIIIIITIIYSVCSSGR